MNTEMIYDAKWPEEFAERLKNNRPLGKLGTVQALCRNPENISNSRV